jgi:hypothetical protein
MYINLKKSITIKLLYNFNKINIYNIMQTQYKSVNKNMNFCL